MAPYVKLIQRDDGSTTKSGVSTIAIAGFALAGTVLLCLGIWMLVLFYRKRSRAKRAEAQGAAFLTVKGVVKDTDAEKSSLPSDAVGFHNGTSTFSRANLTASVVLPDKTLLRPDATPEEVLAHHAAEGTLPRPFAPFSFALSAASSETLPSSPRASKAALAAPGTHAPRPHSSSASFISAMRDSFFGGGGGGSPRSSRLSTASTASSLRTGAGLFAPRKVRQLFTPILPDELVLSLGETVTVQQAFDDGWCVVGRASPFGARGDVELGAVPAWCFVKPLKGLRSERPVRSSSLGVTVQLDAAGPTARDDIISWSNF